MTATAAIATKIKISTSPLVFSVGVEPLVELVEGAGKL
jgi:hypothetical protein